MMSTSRKKSTHTHTNYISVLCPRVPALPSVIVPFNVRSFKVPQRYQNSLINNSLDIRHMQVVAEALVISMRAETSGMRASSCLLLQTAAWQCCCCCCFHISKHICGFIYEGISRSQGCFMLCFDPYNRLFLFL